MTMAKDLEQIRIQGKPLWRILEDALGSARAKDLAIQEIVRAFDTYRNIKDMTGMKFNMLTAIKYESSRHGEARWLFRCDCGKEKEIRAKDVRIGRTKSCGCLRSVVRKNNARASDDAERNMKSFE
jgi:hypothetical protein